MKVFLCRFNKCIIKKIISDYIVTTGDVLFHLDTFTVSPESSASHALKYFPIQLPGVI